MRLLLGLVASLIFLAPASAQQAGSPEALQAANELISIMSEDMINELNRAMTAQVWPTIERKFGMQVDKATLSELRAQFEYSVSKFVENAIKEAPKVYARYFTAQELREMAAFYQTPTGTKALQLMPK